MQGADDVEVNTLPPAHTHTCTHTLLSWLPVFNASLTAGEREAELPSSLSERQTGGGESR